MVATAPALSSPVNHVFVDFENVHDIDLSVLGSKTARFTLFLGSRQTRLDAALVESLLKHAAAIQLVRLTTAGRNALDFTLAYYVGRTVAADPTGIVHIVSKDKGYDALIQHLGSQKTQARRHDSFATLPFERTTKSGASRTQPIPPKSRTPAKARAGITAHDPRAIQVLEHFRKHSTTRPRNKNRLTSYLVAHLANKITEAEASALVETLAHAGHLALDDKGKVTYHLEPKPARDTE